MVAANIEQEPVKGVQGYCATCQKHFINGKGLHEHLISMDNHRVGYVDPLDAISKERAINNGLDPIVLKKIWESLKTDVVSIQKEEEKLTVFDYWNPDQVFYVECECGYETVSQPNDPFGKYVDSLIGIHRMTFPEHAINKKQMTKSEYLMLVEEKKKKAKLANASH